METSGIEQMDVTVCGEASAPLPIRQPNSGPYKKQAFPMISKRPEHLRMNLWQHHFCKPWKVENQERIWAPLKLKFEGLFGLLLKSDSIKESVIAQRDLESKEKRIFFPVNQWCIKKKTLANGIAEL